ncbi:MAG TPA: ribosome biogenesis GTP-binding protein YihA/YsxC, partial [Saprospiraceae bacterium]|nr:ribosome biogenesis GTP-binding protein YihA/YsxC [Saprospiraceae bacterium]
CPPLDHPEYCFIGRSNVGKSSFINFLTGKDDLARTSKKPGKTQTINLYKVMENPEWYLADLPGYGYAHVGKSERQQWSEMINQYILVRANLMNVFLLLDIRHAPMALDRAFMHFLGEHQVPFAILFTKSDKLKPNALRASVDAYHQAILEDWEELPPSFITSSVTQTGRDEILSYIREMNNTFVQQGR